MFALYDYLHRDSDIIYEENFDCRSIYQRLVIDFDGKKLTDVRKLHRNLEGLERITL